MISSNTTWGYCYTCIMKRSYERFKSHMHMCAGSYYGLTTYRSTTPINEGNARVDIVD